MVGLLASSAFVYVFMSSGLSGPDTTPPDIVLRLFIACTVYCPLAILVTSRMSQSPHEGPLVPEMPRPEAYDLLSNRERAVIERLLARETLTGIAHELGVSPSAVGTYRTRAFEKLGVASVDNVRRMVEEAARKPRAVSETVGTGPRRTRRLLLVLSLLLCLLVQSYSGSADAERFLLLFAVALSVGSLCGAAEGACAQLECGHVMEVGCFRLSRTGLSLVTLGAYSLLLMRDSLLVYSLPFSAVALAFLPPLAHAVRSAVEGARAVGTVSLLAAVADGLFGVPVLSSLGASAFCALVPPFAQAAIQGAAFDYGPLVWAVVLLVGIVSCTVSLSGEAEPRSDVRAESRVRSYLLGRGLSDRQAQVAMQTALGLSQSQIAESLCLSTATIGSYRHAAYRLLGVHRRDELQELLRKDAGWSM